MNQSLRNQKQLSKKVTEKMLENELHRLITMSEKRLEGRVNRINNPVKLEAFRTVAVWCEVYKIAELAKRQRDLVIAV